MQGSSGGRGRRAGSVPARRRSSSSPASTPPSGADRSHGGVRGSACGGRGHGDRSPRSTWRSTTRSSSTTRTGSRSACCPVTCWSVWRTAGAAPPRSRSSSRSGSRRPTARWRRSSRGSSRCVYETDGFDVTLWTYEPPAPQSVSPGDYAQASSGGTTACGGSTSRRRTTRIASRRPGHRRAAATAVPRSRTPTGSFSAARCDARRRAIDDRAAVEQLLHGEPHPGNVLSTRNGPLFVDLETCCRGPVEFDLAHVPEDGQRALSER